MKTKHVSTLFSTLLFLLSLQSTFAVNVFDVYKMFQLEKATLPYGSQRAIGNLTNFRFLFRFVYVAQITIFMSSCELCINLFNFSE